MSRTLALFFTILLANAATFDTSIVNYTPEVNQSSPVLSAIDAEGNVILVLTQDCACAPILVTKVDATGKVLTQRRLGAVAQGIQASRLTLDSEGNILIAATTFDRQIPTVRPIGRPLPESRIYAFLWQLSPDASQIVFADYVGAGEVQEVKTDAKGNVALLLFNASASEYVIAKLSPSRSEQVYALTVPNAQVVRDLTLGADGSAQTILFRLDASGQLYFIWRVNTDGARTDESRMDLPGGISPVRLLAAPEGGWWVTGEVGQAILSTTPDAYQRERTSYAYQRWEDGQGITPFGIMRNLDLRRPFVDPTYRDRIYSLSTRGLLRSENNGWTWDVIKAGPEFQQPFIYAASGGGRVWILSGGPNTLVASDDAGRTWRSLNPPPVASGEIVAHPTDPKTLYVSGADGIFTTHDSGENWAFRSFNGYVRIAIDPAAPNTVLVYATTFPMRFVAARSSFHLSRDGGDTFAEAVEAEVGSANFHFNPFHAGTIFYSTFGLLKHASIADLAHPLATANSTEVLSFGFHPSQPGVLLAITMDGSMLRSMNSGVNWTEESGQRLPLPAIDMAIGEGGVLHVSLQANNSDLFVAKLDARGHPAYVTYLGGQKNETLESFGTTANGEIYLAGETASPDFPGIDIGTGRRDEANPDLFVTFFTPSGAIAGSTVLGRLGREQLLSAAPTSTGSFRLFGTASTDTNVPYVLTTLHP